MLLIGSFTRIYPITVNIHCFREIWDKRMKEKAHLREFFTFNYTDNEILHMT